METPNNNSCVHCGRNFQSLLSLTNHELKVHQSVQESKNRQRRKQQAELAKEMKFKQEQVEREKIKRKTVRDLNVSKIDKFLVCDNTVSTNGEAVLQQLDKSHPATKILLDFSKSEEVGDNTSTAVFLCMELLKESKVFILDGMHPEVIVKNIRSAACLAVKKLTDLSWDFDDKSIEEKKLLWGKYVTSLSSKLTSGMKELFSTMVVDTFTDVGPSLSDILNFNDKDDSLHDPTEEKSNCSFVAGGGAVEMELSQYLREHAATLAGKSQRIINSYANALEVIPWRLCEKSGLNGAEVLRKLREKHKLPHGQGSLYGVDINNPGIVNTYANYIWEAAVPKRRALTAATEAACLVLTIDKSMQTPKKGKGAMIAVGGG